MAISMPGPLETAPSSPLACSGHAFDIQAATPAIESTAITKSAAILGGQPSALDLIRQQQSDLDLAPEPALLSIRHTSVAAPGQCLASFGWIAGFTDNAVAASNTSEDFLESPRVGIRLTPFNQDWQRVSTQELSPAHVASLLPVGTENAVETLAQVNAWANRRIEFSDDFDIYGTRDHWATADETLASGAGDCEDYAILKYQILSALGFDRSEMYLTLARDLVRNADHAVLVVRLGEQDYLLDNSTDVLLSANEAHDYRPTLSFNSQSAWLHGYSGRRHAASAPSSRAFAYLSDNALSNALVIGLNR